MPRYLLGTQSVIDAAKRLGRPPEHWMHTAATRGIYEDDVVISAVTAVNLQMGLNVALAKATTTAEKFRLDAIKKNAEELIDRFVRGGHVIPVTKEIADRWGELLDYDLFFKTEDGRGAKYKFDEKLVFATAIVGAAGIPFILVDKHQAAHDDLAALGLLVEDPYQLDYGAVGP
jgi:predicted nucleic acid-binding protein